jgi:hypothetical protein
MAGQGMALTRVAGGEQRHIILNDENKFKAGQGAARHGRAGYGTHEILGRLTEEPFTYERH